MIAVKSVGLESQRIPEDEEEEEEDISEDESDNFEDASKSSMYEESIKIKFESSLVPTIQVTLKPCTTRRTIAEDMRYNLLYVKSLRNTILEYMAKTFGENQVDFNLLPPDDAQYVVDRISLNVPLDVATKTIPYESYWEKKCKTQIGKWFIGKEVDDFGGSYRRMFFEWYLSNELVEFIPFVSDQKQLIKNFEIGGEFVKTLDLDEMLITVKGRSSDDAPEILAKNTYSHVDLGIVGPYLSGLERLRLKYRVSKCGLNFDWAMCYCTTLDMKNLCRLTTFTPNLKELTINHSRLDDVKVKILVWCLVPLESLRTLDLSHNCLKNDSARFLAKLLLKNPPLELLNLTDNSIHSEGAMALFYSLQHNKHLRHLNLNLNFVDFKATNMLNSMACINDTLETLVLSANDITDEFCEVVADMMSQFTCITTLDLSSNTSISDVGLKSLMNGWEKNNKLRKIILKGTYLQDDVLECVRQMINVRNRKNIL